MTNEEKSEKPINPMTNHITIITDNTGTKAWTVNPVEKPEHYDLYSKYGSFTQYGESLVADSVKWQQAESERKCYKIEPHRIVSGHNGICKEWTTIIYEPNTRYLAEIVDENTVRILKEVK